MHEPQPASGNILLYVRVRNPERRMLLNSELVNLPGERVSSNIWELFTEDWDEGLWEEELQKIEDLVDPGTDSLLYWHVVNGKLMRTCIAGRFV